MVAQQVRVAVAVVLLANHYLGTIVIPVFNEADTVVPCLQKLLTQVGEAWKLVIVDGGSSDETAQLAKQFPVTLLSGEAGRAAQLNLGAQHSEGEIVLFLHVDTSLPENFQKYMGAFLQSPKRWGRFNIRLQPASLGLKVIAWFMNQRSRYTGIATGDQAIFVRLHSFQAVGGFPQIPLMEDVAICKLLKRVSKPYCIYDPVISSSRRWQNQGLVKTVVLMWWLRLAYFCGVSPKRLHRWYYPQQS